MLAEYSRSDPVAGIARRLVTSDNKIGATTLRRTSPMLATSAATLPVGDDWTYEVKFDGYRMLAVKEARRVVLLSRNLKDMTEQFPSVARMIAQLGAKSVLLDGEVVALGHDGRPSFQGLHQQNAHDIVYYAFDLLHLNGHELMKRPLHERRSLLRDLLKDTAIRCSEPLPGTPDQIERAVRRLQLEGVVAKRGSSLYEPGQRCRSWVKVKFNRRQEFLIGGFKPNGTNFESLLVGYREGGKLYFAGKVRAGLKPFTRAEVFRKIGADQIERCPFVNLPSRTSGHWGEGVTAEDMVRLRWVKPRVVVEVSFVEWEGDGVLRHAEFVALREDKRASDVRREPISPPSGN